MSLLFLFLVVSLFNKSTRDPMTILEKEYRIDLPFTLEEYSICQLYTAAEMSLSETKGDAGIEIIENADMVHEAIGNCRKTHKVMYLNSRVPSAIRAVLPKKSLILDEISYNSFPKCYTTYTNRIFSEDRFLIIVKSDHKMGEIQENVLNLDENVYSKIEKDYIRIDEPAVDPKFDPLSYEKTCDRKINAKTHKMTCYKYVKIMFEVWGFGWMSYEIEKQIRKIFLSAHQRMYCTMDKWKHLTINDIRKLEEDAKRALEKKKEAFISE